MAVLRYLSLEASRAWDRFASRTHLRALPAMPAAAAVVALGLIAPLLAQVDDQPPGLAPSLATERLERFLASRNVWPAGDIVVDRPELAWAPIPRAATYGVALQRGEGPAVATGDTEGTTFQVETLLAPGTYRVDILGRDVAGEVVGRWEGMFTIVDAVPRGEIESARPAFHWRPVPGATGYRVRVLRGEAEVVLERTESEPRTVVRPPAVVKPGTYRLEVEAEGADGRVLAMRRASFTVRPRGDVRGLGSDMRMVLEPADAAFVLAGHYAARGSAPDVVSALETYLQARGGAADPLARRALARCGVR